MSEQEKLEKNLETVHNGIKAIQEKVDSQGDKLDGIDQAYIKKAGEEAAKALEEITNLKAADRFAEMEATQKELAEEMIDMRRSGDVQEKTLQDHEMATYLRKGVAPSDEATMGNVKNYLAKNTYGANENEIDMLSKDILSGSNTDGGFLVTADRSSTMQERIFETSPLRAHANIVTTVSDMYEIILDDDEAAAGWVGEIQSRPTTDTPQIGLLKIPVHELYAKPKATQKNLDDSGIDVEGWLAGKVSRVIGRKENTSFVVGDGSQKPKGFLSYSDWTAAGVYQRDAVEQISSGSAGSFDGDDVIGLKNQLIEDYQANAAFGMNRSTFTTVATLKDSSGRYLLNQQVLAEGSDKVLLGNEVVFMNDIPVIATDALALVVADFREFYTIVDRFGIRVLRDPYSAKPYVEFYTTKRVGGAVSNFEAGKILKLSA